MSAHYFMIVDYEIPDIVYMVTLYHHCCFYYPSVSLFSLALFFLRVEYFTLCYNCWDFSHVIERILCCHLGRKTNITFSIDHFLDFYATLFFLFHFISWFSVVWQGMRLLPTGRKNALAIFVYSSLVGINLI